MYAGAPLDHFGQRAAGLYDARTNYDEALIKWTESQRIFAAGSSVTTHCLRILLHGKLARTKR